MFPCARPREARTPIRTEKNGAVWTVIHSRPETRNAVDPDRAASLCKALRSSTVAPCDCRGWWGKVARWISS